MSGHVMRLFTDTIEPRASLETALPSCNRYVYVAEGMATVRGERTAATLGANSAWFDAREITLAAGADGAVVLRWELCRAPAQDDGIVRGPGVRSALTLSADIALDESDGYLLRGDKVELPPGGIAYTHIHAGGGIRCLLVGAFNVEVAGRTKTFAPYEAWFERGPDPVYAWAPDDSPGHFARVMILPRRYKGKSSITYVKDEENELPRRQNYTVFADEFIEI